MNKEHAGRAQVLMDGLTMSHTPIAVAVVQGVDKIPKNCYRPFKQDGVHYVMCQLMSMVKEKHIAVALSKEDQWCWKPLIGFGHVDMEPGTREFDIGIRNNGIADLAASAENFKELPKLSRNDENVVLISPVDICEFDPDVVLMYCDNLRQLRWMIGAIKLRSGQRLATELDYIDSCLWSTIPTMKTRRPWVTIPDPGEETRGACPMNEIILTVPIEMFDQLCIDAAMKIDNHNRRLKNPDGTYKMACEMVPDFPRPKFYNELYEIWGLDSNGKVAWSERDRE